MVKRIRWFFLGAASMFGVLAYLSTQVRRARVQLTPETMARTGARSFADALNAVAARLDPEPAASASTGAVSEPEYPRASAPRGG
jgi:hypothetical protein